MNNAQTMLLLKQVEEHLRCIQPSLDSAGYRAYANQRLLEDVWDAIGSLEKATVNEQG